MKLKKLLSVALVLSLVVAFAACSKKESGKEPTKKPTDKPTAAPTATMAPTEAPTEAPTPTEAPAASNAMTYQQFVAAELETEVTIEAYVQAKQSWWDNKATVYTMDRDGAYFLYEMACSEADYAKLVPGTKIRVKGYKAEWSGEVEIIDSTFEILAGDTYIAQPQDVTAMLGSENLSDYMNRFVSFKGMTVTASTYSDDAGVEHEAAWLYKWNGTGAEGDDLYFNVSLNGKVYTFTVESYLCGKDTDVYKAVKELQIGDVIDMEGFLYWYNGANPHITSVAPASAETGTTPAADVKSEGVMTYAQYVAAALDDEVTIEAYVQAKQSWWDNKATVYTMDRSGGYFLYEMACSEADYAKLVPGTKLRVKGYKSEWSGEVEITDATFEILADDTYIAEPVDVTELLDKDNLSDYMNRYVSFMGMTVEASKYTDDAGEEHEAAWLYKWNGTGAEGDDLYFNVSYNGKTYTFTVESYLCGKDTDVYKAVKELKVGDTVAMEGFLYWYNGANPHITSVSVKAPR